MTPAEVFHVPGPGSYAYYTQFNNDQKMLSIKNSVLEAKKRTRGAHSPTNP